MSYVNVEMLPAGRFVEAETEAFLHELGPKIVARAQELAPVRTGELRDSIDYHVAGPELTIEATAPYAGYVEAGTSKMAAQPFLGPAMSEFL